MTDSLEALLERLRVLIDADRAVAGPVREIEDVLTYGYAQAIALEVEQAQLRRTITELAERVEELGASRALRRMTLELRSREGDGARLRGLLDNLRRQADRLREELA